MESRPSLMPPPPNREPRLYKEYVICDLTLYKTGNIGLRWCLERDILSGKGKTICGNKHCAYDRGEMHSYEVLWKREETREMVTVNLCEECAVKLNYKKYKDKRDKKKKKRGKKKRNKSNSSESD
ncbi:hypothetical protein FGO68_gene10465 [Halteria grandinella]|uniref:Uncharacterized protein n=1 Tax=Halteria grandinella TaxID=5974 RepID=A0A8J8NX57_HALGN|nr:hypothetical protein FGO68_gene10465 [Halteria grandinella]